MGLQLVAKGGIATGFPLFQPVWPGLSSPSTENGVLSPNDIAGDAEAGERLVLGKHRPSLLNSFSR